MYSEVHGHLQSYSTPITFSLLVVILLYARGWRRLWIEFRNVLPIWRLVSFMSGVLALWVVVGTPVAQLDHRLLTAHMGQHLLLMTVAAPLVLLGAPIITLLHGLPNRFVATSLVPLLRFEPARWFGRTVAHPAVCWLAATLAVIGWHIPTAFNLAMRSDWWHKAAQVSFFTTGLLFWLPVVQPWPTVSRWPRWSIPLYLFFATLPCDALSAFLVFCGRIVYPSYMSANGHALVSPLKDQMSAGALMWVWVTVIYLIPAVVITIRILSPPTTRPPKIDRLRVTPR